jgi:hypothetical protein
LALNSSNRLQSPPASTAAYFQWDNSGSGYDPFSFGHADVQQQDSSFAQPLQQQEYRFIFVIFY